MVFSVRIYIWFISFQSRDAAISFQLTPAIHLSELRYLIKINSLSETSLTDIQKENDIYKTDNVNVSYGGKYFYYKTGNVNVSYGGKYFYYKTGNVNVSFGGKYFYYKTDNMNVPYGGKYFYYTIKLCYAEL